MSEISKIVQASLSFAGFIWITWIVSNVIDIRNPLTTPVSVRGFDNPHGVNASISITRLQEAYNNQTLFQQQSNTSPLSPVFEGFEFNPNYLRETSTDIVLSAKHFSNESEWHKRFLQSDLTWLNLLDVSPIDSGIALPVRYQRECLLLVDSENGGLGNKLFRFSNSFAVSALNRCKLGVYWPLSEHTCSQETLDHNRYNHTNLFALIFNDNNEISPILDLPQRHLRHMNMSALQGKQLFGNAGIYINPAFTRRFSFQEPPIGLDELVIDQSSYLGEPMTDQFFLNNGQYLRLRRFNGHYQYRSILRSYGLLMKQLKPQFRRKTIEFVNKYFKDWFVVGVHMRSGNGETFTNKRMKATVENMFTKLRNALRVIVQDPNISSVNSYKQIRIFAASDSESVVHLLRYNMSDIFGDESAKHIVALPQSRIPLGYGHMYHSVELDNGNLTIDCAQQMADAYLDTEILGFTDVMVQPSHSTTTRLSRVLMMLRKKVLCVWFGEQQNRFNCKNFENGHQI